MGRAPPICTAIRAGRLRNGKTVSAMNPNDQLEPTVFVIFGGAGDLTWWKLVPPHLTSQDRSPPTEFSVIAVARLNMSDKNLRRRLHVGVKKFARHAT
jgi:glucose-6-phosphate 1-dehydrogenase